MRKKRAKKLRKAAQKAAEHQLINPEFKTNFYRYLKSAWMRDKKYNGQ